MPIGTSKIGILGGQVPGGSQTFNSPGTFVVPLGVTTVNITGKGGNGTPGNPGTAGTVGNPGTSAACFRGGGGWVS